MNFLDSPLSKPAPYVAAPIEHRFDPYEDNGGYVPAGSDSTHDPNFKHLIHSFDTVLVLPLLEKTFVSLLQIRDRAMVI
jgi:hypothetical protein